MGWRKPVAQFEVLSKDKLAMGKFKERLQIIPL
jgi:hypothetical protein